MIAFSAERSLVVARRIARATKGAVSDPNPLGDPVLRKVIKVPPSTASQVYGGLHRERPLGGAHHRPLPGHQLGDLVGVGDAPAQEMCDERDP